jgi:signal transduction histidine kinase
MTYLPRSTHLTSGRWLYDAAATFSGSVRWGLLLLVLVAALPLFLVQSIIYGEWYLSRRADELVANREIARSVATSFMAFIRDVSRQNATVNAAVQMSEPDFLAHAQRLFDTNRSEYPSIDAWYLVDTEGKIIAAARTELLGRRPPVAQVALKTLLAGHREVVTDLIVQGPSGHEVFAIARRLEDEHQRCVGAVVAEIDPTKLNEVALTLERIEAGRYAIYDGNGTQVFSSPEVPRSGSARKKDPLLDQALRERRGTQGVVELPPDNRRYLAARVYMADLGWVVGASRPIDVAMADEVRSLQWIVVANLLIVGLSGVGATLIGRRIVRHLTRLEEHAQALGQGELQHRVAPGGPRELAELGTRFNQMAERLQQRAREVEQAMADLARSNRELEQFAYVASHDLQEPLRVITGYLQLIERRYHGKLDEEAEQFIAYVVEAVFRMQQLIADLLEYSRVGMRGRPFQRVAMERVFDEALAALGQSVAESNAVVEHGPLPEVVGDPTQLRQLLQNLIGNAIKFHRSCVPTIHVSARGEESQWVFAVRDNGIGIEPQYWERIFVIFQRLHSRQQYSGTGIGLAICKRIVERHGGRIWVDSVAGIGSTFYFTISRRLSPAERLETVAAD